MSASPQINNREDKCREMVLVAKGILNGDIGIIAGARQLSRLRFHSRTEKDSDILFFVGIDSETDDLPLGDVRRHWNPEALMIKDEELRRYESRLKEQAFRACHGLIARYDLASNAPPDSN